MKRKTASAGRGRKAADSGIKRVQYSRRNTSASDAQPVYAGNGRVIGHTIRDTFYKRARGSIHMLRAPQGWATDVDVLKSLRAGGIERVSITDTETDTTYVASLATYERYGVAVNRGYGAQVVLPLGYWTVNGAAPQLSNPESSERGGRQLSLFGEEPGEGPGGISQ